MDRKGAAANGCCCDVVGAPVPNASKVGGSVVVRESGLKSPIAVSCQVEIDLTSSTFNVNI